MPAYDGIIKAYFEDNPHSMMDVINQYYEELNYDLNLGIAKQVHHSLLNRRFQKLSKIYISLSLDQISDKVGMEDESEVMTHLLELSYTDEVKIKIDDLTKNVRFTEYEVNGDDVDTLQSTSNEVDLSSSTLQQLQDGLQTTILLSEKVRELRKNVLTSSKYIMKMSSSSKMGGNTKKRGGESSNVNIPGGGY